MEQRRSRKMKRYKGKADVRRQLFLILIRALIALSALGIVVFSVILIKTNNEYSVGDSTYDDLRLLLNPAGDSTASTAGMDVPEGSSLIDFSELRAINTDTVGWILAEGRNIDYPIVQGEDNSYYLNHLFNHEENRLGSIFLDYRNNGDFSDRSIVIYGHNMKNGSMFTPIREYRAQEYYDMFPTMELYTPEENYTIELFAGIIADGNYEFVRFDFENDEDFRDYIQDLKKNSTFKSEVTVNPEDKIVALVTCTYEYNNARYTIFGKLTPTLGS